MHRNVYTQEKEHPLYGSIKQYFSSLAGDGSYFPTERGKKEWY